MIEKIKLRNFKSLRDVSLILGNLNVITGINGVGKSSLIQSILLLRQAYQNNHASHGISLDGPYTGNLGCVKDIENSQSDNDEIEININGASFLFSTGERRDETVLKGDIDFGPLENNPIFSLDRFQYISASRASPETQFVKNTYAIENKNLGKNGEFAVSYISENGQKAFDKDHNFQYRPLVCIAEDNDKIPLPLEGQINYWLNFVSDNVRLRIVKTTATKYELYFESFNGLNWDSYTAVNSAFGLTYSLPIITSLLIARAGDVVILENPESDLHPKAQSKMGELLGYCANAGIQIIVETHSDHVLNGIRLAVSNSPQIISHEKIKIFYFHKESMLQATEVEEIEIDSNGRMPIKELRLKGITGFFDQIDQDYKRLLLNQHAKN
ncbi:AAA family ATPase [Arcticibacter tournemirensis]|uniref:ATPase AAA-type core domain-containing protein n=1 Tax=Arcticibacter tournemirensis TaxID=699437 RepID=A0A4Q0MGA2_9SPHI|nr:AAA family ATPase [Arcticibacter tournemirensis]RXF71966.1 hypothetical protein EKH83_04600 [Arcticibacter tournemirensis]